MSKRSSSVTTGGSFRSMSIEKVGFGSWGTIESDKFTDQLSNQKSDFVKLQEL